MADLTPTPGWTAVPRLETTTPALAGSGAPMNTQAQALLNRTEQLKASLDTLTSEVSNVDNTSDLAKPISAATQTALDSKAPLDTPTFTGFVSGISKAMVGLGNVDNTSDLSKPLSSAVQSALGFKAPLADPVFTGAISTINSTNGLQVTGAAGNVNSTATSGPTVVLNKIAGAYTSAIYGSRASSSRWILELGNSTNEGGSNSGSDFSISRYADNGSLIGASLVIARSTGNVTISSAMTVGGTATFNSAVTVNAAATVTGLTVSSTSVSAVLNKSASGQTATLVGRMNGVNRWVISLGASDAETGSNVGSNFYITRCADNGTSNGDVFNINRATGAANFGGSLGVGANLGVATSGTFGSTVNALGYTAQGYGVYMLQGLGAQNVGGSTLGCFVLHCNNGLGLPATQEVYHNQGVNAYWQWVISGAAFRMQDNGVGYSNGGWTATSDQRVKHNNQVIENALDKVDQLTGYTYDREDMVGLDGVRPRKAGVIAQDVLKVLPETVVVPKNYNPETNEGDLLALHTDGLIGLLVNAVKELRAEVMELRSKLS